MSDTHDKAWGDFWAEQQARGDSGGCLPSAYRGIEQAQQEAWSSFAKNLEAGASVLDLATGDGRVMGWLRDAGHGLLLVGVDLAPNLPAAPEGTESRGGVAMEELPFADDRFDVAVSQFGFEYGDVPRAAKEVARVLRPAGELAILTHRIDGPILAHNRNRRMQIGWIFERKDLFGVAETALDSGATGPTIQVEQAVQEGAHRFGRQSAAWEIAEAIRRTMAMRGQTPIEQVRTTLHTIAERARNEIGRIDSLEAACRTTEAAEEFAAALAAAGFDELEQRPVSEGENAPPFADFRHYRLSS